jgi:hypothetical protein
MSALCNAEIFLALPLNMCGFEDSKSAEDDVGNAATNVPVIEVLAFLLNAL